MFNCLYVALHHTHSAQILASFKMYTYGVHEYTFLTGGEEGLVAVSNWHVPREPMINE